MKKILLVLLVLLLAFSVFGLKTPAEILDGFDDTNPFEDIRGFFVDTLTGSANYEDAYFLSFILYFIIFMSLFVEGLKMLPLFGGKGEISTPGKWFAGAAAGLANIAIFLTEQSTGQTTGELVGALISPFGLWGGGAIAGIFAFITWKAIRDIEMFNKNIILTMAVALAVGFTTAGFIMTLPTLMGWGYFMIFIASILGLVGSFTFARDDGKSWFGGGDSDTTPSDTPTTPSDSTEAENTKKTAEKEERAAINLYVSLQNLRRELRKEFKEGDGKLDDVKNFKYIKMRATRRNMKRMNRRIKKLRKNLERIKTGAGPKLKAKVNTWETRINIFWDLIIKMASRTGAFDKNLAKPAAGFADYKGKQGKAAKYFRLLDIVTKAIEADRQLVALSKQIEKELK